MAHLFTYPGPSPSRDRGWQNVLASLDRLRVTAFIVNANGTVHQQDDSARSLLAGNDSVHVADSRLRFSDPALNTTLDTALRKATEASRRSSLFPVRTGKSEVYEVNVSPLQSSERRRPAPALPLALVVIARPRPDAERIARRVRQVYGLTEAEARVVAARRWAKRWSRSPWRMGFACRPCAQVRSIFEDEGTPTDRSRAPGVTGAPVPARSLTGAPSARLRPKVFMGAEFELWRERDTLRNIC